MKVVNNNKKYICAWCGTDITTKRKVRWSAGKTYHLSCLYDYALRKFEEWRLVKNKLSKYKQFMVIERLK